MKKIFYLFTLLSLIFLPVFHHCDAVVLKPSTFTCKTLDQKDSDYKVSSAFIKKYIKGFDEKKYLCTKCSGKNYINFSPKNLYSLNKKNIPYMVFDVEIKKSAVKSVKIQEKNLKSSKEEIIDKNKKNLYIKKAKEILGEKNATYMTSFIPSDKKKNKKIPSDSVSVVFSLKNKKYFVIEISNPSKNLRSINIFDDKKSLDSFVNTNSFKNL